MLVYVEVWFNHKMIFKAKNKFSKKEKVFVETHPWVSGYYDGVVNDFEIHDFVESSKADLERKLDKYRVGDQLPFAETFLPYHLTEKPTVDVNVSSAKKRNLSDMSVEEVLEVATIPQVISEFGNDRKIFQQFNFDKMRMGD